MMKIFSAFCLWSILFAGTVYSDGTKELTKEKEVQTKTIPPYCGIHSVCLAMRGMGMEADFATFVDSKYLGSKKGSSLSDLERLCGDVGLYCQVFRKLTISSLSYSLKPIILHTTFRPGSQNYEHWTLFTGINNNRADLLQVVDGKAVLESITLDELAARWDGVGLFLSERLSFFTSCSYGSI